MSIYVALLGELLLIEVFVFYLWLKVLISSLGVKDGSLESRKILLTSIGLVFNAGAILGIISFRVYELATGFWPFVWGIVVFYALLAAGNFMFIVSASLGGNQRLLKVFLSVSALWTVYCVYWGLS